MVERDWSAPEAPLFDRCESVLRGFAGDHPGVAVSLFAFVVDADYAGVGLAFDTPANSLRWARMHQQREIQRRERLFATPDGWKTARSDVGHPARQVDDFNRNGEWQFEQVDFISVPLWEDYYIQAGDLEEYPELEGRITVTLWRVLQRLVVARAFDDLQRVAPFRVGLSFARDIHMVVLQILDWPSSAHDEPD